MKKLFAEFFGTYWLVFGGCGSALFAAGYPELGIGFAGVALAFGLTVLTMAYAVGHISGGHFNPAVSIGLWAGGRFSAKDVLPYIASQCAGAIAAAGTLFYILSGKAGFAIELTSEISDNSNIPIIASGGAGSMEHFYDVFTTGKADAGLAASIFHFKEIGIPELKNYLKDKVA